MCKDIGFDVSMLRAAHGSPDRKSRGKSGTKAHPKAPRGSGGPGGFVVPGVKKDRDASGGRRVLDASDTKSGGSAKQKPPPATNPVRKEVLKRNGRSEDIEVHVEILADAKSSNPDLKGAKTAFDSSSISFSTPGYFAVSRRGRNVVTRVDGVFELKGTIVIQTTYGPGSKSTDRSLYGRGTTTKDETRGDTSLGFHEHCHQQDYLRFLKDKPLPRFSGKVGQTEAAFKKAADLLEKAFTRYWAEMEKYSLQRTDEVGRKRSRFIKGKK